MNMIKYIASSIIVVFFSVAIISPFIYILLPFKIKYKIADKLGIGKILDYKPIDPNSPINCPCCGSTQVSAHTRGWSLLTGFWDSGQVYITCLKCGRRWKAGKY